MHEIPPEHIKSEENSDILISLALLPTGHLYLYTDSESSEILLIRQILQSSFETDIGLYEMISCSLIAFAAVFAVTTLLCLKSSS